ncbi:DUF2155 domain-containing protein [Dongia deserti]|uniref:DUF2155 domain-containing protein n=1 Tax=Dongia deserti TaxID=2268030 RepID=UPI0025480F7B|nr:DUF2155 domain-containing protein [Dongia deserti]
MAPVVAALVAAATPAYAIQMEEAVLQGLDKITARISTIKVAVGETVSFGSLQITLRACDKRPPEETPESAAFLQVVEQKPGEQPVTRFSGWMFASSPALSAMEHPVYDLWVLDCENKGTAEAEQGPQPEQAPASQGEALPEEAAPAD